MVKIFMILFITLAFAQNKEDLAFIMQTHQNKTEQAPSVAGFPLKETAELKLFATGLIRFYQLFISPQDLPSCNYTLSCSRFGMRAIKEYGLFYGILMTSDRLHRCNGFGRKYYPIDAKTGLAVDYPIESYYIMRPRGGGLH